MYVGAVITTATGTYGIANIKMLDVMPEGLREPEPIRYDGETANSRSSRREERWTPTVIKSMIAGERR